MNFGTKIAIAVAVFVVFILVLSLIMMSKQTETVEKDYYEKDLRYEEEIQAQRNASKFPVLFQPLQDTLWVRFQKKVDYDKGEILFIRPDDSQKDFSLPLQLDSLQKQKIYDNRLIKGLWKVQIKWQKANKNYASPMFEWILP